MARPSQLLTPFPFCPKGVAGGATYFPWVDPNPWPLQQLHRVWHRVNGLAVRLTLTVDPFTSATGSSTIQYLIPLDRQGVVNEFDLCWPGFDDDVRTGPDLTGPFGWTGGLAVGLPGDDVFSSVTWSAALDVFGCGAMGGLWNETMNEYPRPLLRYEETADELLWTPAMRLVVNGTFDDGTEGTFTIQSPNPEDYVGAAPDDMLALVGTFDGVPFNAVAIDFSPTYAFGGVAPQVEIVRATHYEYRTLAGAFPLYDIGTGDLLPGANPDDGRY